MFPPSIEPSRPALVRWPIFAVPLDPDDLQPIEAGTDAFDRHGTIEVSREAAAWFEFPFPALADGNEEPIARTAFDDAAHCVKRA